MLKFASALYPLYKKRCHYTGSSSPVANDERVSLVCQCKPADNSISGKHPPYLDFWCSPFHTTTRSEVTRPSARFLIKSYDTTKLKQHHVLPVDHTTTYTSSVAHCDRKLFFVTRSDLGLFRGEHCVWAANSELECAAVADETRMNRIAFMFGQYPGKREEEHSPSLARTPRGMTHPGR